MSFSVEALREATECMVPDNKARIALRRTLGMIGVEASPRNVRMAAALKHLGVGRLHRETFTMWSERLEVRTGIRTKVYMQKKASAPNLDQDTDPCQAAFK